MQGQAQGRRGLSGRTLLVLLGFLLMAGFLLLGEHRLHALGFLPWLLLLACPLMHVFMHHGPGDHGGAATKDTTGNASSSTANEGGRL